jgi:hypothetical protein
MVNRLVRLVIVFLSFFLLTAKGISSEKISAEVARIHEEALTIDTHVDIAGTEYATNALDPGIDHPQLRALELVLKFRWIHVADGRKPTGSSDSR